METTVPQNALKTLGFLNGDFMMSDTSGQSRGFRMIFGVLMTLKMTCLQFLPRIYMGIANGITMTCGPDSFFKFIFGGLLVPFIATMVFFHTHLYNGVLPFIKNNKDMWIMFYLCFLAMFIINYLFVLCTSAHDFNNSQDRVALEEAAKQNPLLSKKPPTCSKCGISNVLRANHCVTCNTHTAKYHRHSLIFNKCIGAGNMFFYTIFQFFIALLMFIGVSALLLEKDETFVMTKPKKMLFHLLVIIYLLIGIGRVHAFAKNIAYIYYNITEYEATNYKQLAYLWKSMQKEFYNPFDKGPAKNFKEELFTVMNYQEETRKKADVSMDEMRLKENLEDLEDKERKTVEDEKNRIINWRTEKILTLTDIYNSPMRKFFLDYFNKKKTQKKNADSDSD